MSANTTRLGAQCHLVFHTALDLTHFTVVMFYRARRRLESRRGKHECSRHVVAHALFACRLGTLAETFGIRSLRTHLTKLSDIGHSCLQGRDSSRPQSSIAASAAGMSAGAAD